MTRLRVSPTFLALLLVSLVSGSLLGQSQATTGVIEGVVRDESGALLPGVTVTLINKGTNYEQVAITNSEGRFRVVLLPLGEYRVTASLENFGRLTRDGINLGVGQSVPLDMTLRASGLTESIVVTGDAPIVETTRVAGATRIDEASVERLPNNGRNFLDFIKLTPGVTIVQGPDGDELSINGQKGIHNNVSVDGADFNNPFFGEQRGGQRPPFVFNLDAVKEVVVVADGANAEFGRSSGGFVNVITKSGTNQIDGSAHTYIKSDSLSSPAKDSLGNDIPDYAFDQQQVGFTLGGPILADRLFYFTAFDLQRGNAEKQTNPDRIEQRVVDYFTSIGIPNENGSIERSNDAQVFLGKVDWQASQRNLATLRYSHTWSEQENGTFDVDSWARSANATEEDESNALSGSLITTFSDTFLGEFRAQWAREDRPRPYTGPLIAGQDRPLPDTAFDFARGYRFGMPFFIPVEYFDEREQLNANFSKLAGRHLIKGGLEYNHTDAFQTFIGFANGRYIFSSTDGFLNYTRNPQYVDCSDGSSSETGACPAGTDVVGPVLLYLQQAGVGGRTVEEAGTQTIEQTEPAVFIQDSWQPADGLTVDYGLRWEAQIQPDPITPPDQVFFAPFIGTTSMGQEFPSNGKIPSDRDMWQPRFGIAWDPANDGKMVVRANAGIFYARIPGLNLASSRSTNGSVGQTIFRNSALTGILGPVPAYPNLIPVTEIGDPFLPDVFVFDKDFRNPRTTAASIGADRSITNDLAVSLKYNYAKTDYVTRFVNRNDPLLGSPWGSGLEPGGANGINVLTVVESSAKSQYDGITLGVRKRYSQNYQFQAYYTYSKDKSDDDNERDPFSFRYAKVTDLDAEWGYSDRDQRHRFNSWLLWDAPYGMDVNFRYSYRSAQPKSITASGVDAATPQARINPDGSVFQRNRGRKDNEYSSLDIRLSKDFLVSGLTIQPILDIFNLFDSENFRRPESTNLIFNFDGTVQSGAGEPRQAQVGVRLVW